MSVCEKRKSVIGIFPAFLNISAMNLGARQHCRTAHLHKRHAEVIEGANHVLGSPRGVNLGALVRLNDLQLVAREGPGELLPHDFHHGLEGHHLQQAPNLRRSSRSGLAVWEGFYPGTVQTRASHTETSIAPDSGRGLPLPTLNIFQLLPCHSVVVRECTCCVVWGMRRWGRMKSS